MEIVGKPGSQHIRFIPVDHNTLRERDIRFNRK